MKNKIALFYNPVAGGGIFKNNLDNIIYQFQEAGMQVIPWRILSNEQIKNQMNKINPQEYHTIVAAGGDGTVHGVVNAMMQYEINVPLGIFPAGTSNDVANYLRIPDDLPGYCRVIIEGIPQFIDLGIVNGVYFVNVASAGFLTQTAHEVDYRLKNVLGKMAYYLKGIEKIPQMQSLKLDLQVDGTTYNLEALLFLILNGGTAGGFQGLLPEGKMNDGKLDFLAIKAVPLHKLGQLIYRFTRGQHLQDKNIFYCQGQHFTLNVQPRMNTDLDGELGPVLPWKIGVCPNALQVRTL